jgi:hypothetical protein
MFHGWDNYFFMLGSAAASLIGLLFVVVTLTQGFDRAQALRASSIYMTPLAVHFAVVMTVSAISLAPGLDAFRTSLVLGIGALVGLGNAIRTCLGIPALAKDANSPPHWSDVWFYGVAPAVIYVALGAIAAAAAVGAAWATDATAALLLVLLLVGIRNAWDLLTWMAPGGISKPPEPPVS